MTGGSNNETYSAGKMRQQHWLFLILRIADATLSEKIDPGFSPGSSGEDYVVGGVPLLKPPQLSQPSATTSAPGFRDWASFEWVASVRMFFKVNYYPARKDGETREGCEINSLKPNMGHL